MDELDRRQMIKRYAVLKKRRAELDQEMSQLRDQIIAYCEEQQVNELDAGAYRVKLIIQDRKEYDDHKVYAALPDPEIWRLISRADTAKIASTIKLGVLSEESLQGTFTAKRITLLQIDKT
jgi:hypothetical protein